MNNLPEKINISVLVVDDDKANRNLIQAFLKDQLGFDITLLKNGNQAYEHIYKLKTDKPILLITDILMPDINGLTLLNKLKKLHNIYSIVITGHQEQNDLKQAFDAGAIDFIRKPINKIELISRVNNIIRIINTERTLQKLTITDFLTEAYNRKYFMQTAMKEIKKAERHNATLSFILIDIDNFKDINDTLGHQTGDEVLKSFTNLCKSKVRGYDFFCRLGGDEFVLVLINSDIQKTLAVGERIRRAAAQLKVRFHNETVNFTISLGVTEFKTGKNETIKEMLVRADRALYKAKNSGRNKLESY